MDIKKKKKGVRDVFGQMPLDLRITYEMFRRWALQADDVGYLAHNT